MMGQFAASWTAHDVNDMLTMGQRHVDEANGADGQVRQMSKKKKGKKGK
jgi:hypothetical protein